MVKIFFCFVFGMLILVFLILIVIFVCCVLYFVLIVIIILFFLVNFIVLLSRFYNIWCRCVEFIFIKEGKLVNCFKLKCNFFCFVIKVVNILIFVINFLKLRVVGKSFNLWWLNLFILIILLKILFSVIVLILMVCKCLCCLLFNGVFSSIWFKLMILLSGVCSLWLMVEINVVLLWLVFFNDFLWCLCLVILWLKLIKLRWWLFLL